MKHSRWTTVFVSLCAFVFGACAPLADGQGPTDDEGQIAESASSLLSKNGIALNGVGVNGVGVNGVGVNGVGVNGVGVNGVGVNGTQLEGLVGGNPISGQGMAGATFTATLVDGSTIDLHIEAVQQSTSDSEIWFYTLSYGEDPTKTYPCGSNAAGLIPAIALAGRWDYSSGTPTGGDWIDDPANFTFACADSTLAKCLSFGYKPWKTIDESLDESATTHDLRAFHQACTRMIRADYCGDGTPHTINQVPVNLWDNFAIQTQASVPGTWKQDAEWSPEGAVCVKNWRYNIDGSTNAYMVQHCPERLEAGFTCFGNQSTFFTASGFEVPLAERSLIRNEFDFDYVSSTY